MKIYGVVLPEGTENPQNIADEFTPQEINAIALSGLPIWVDHQDRSTENSPYPGVGKIIHDWVDNKDGRKYVVGEIRGTSKEELLTQNRIRHGALKDFSLTHRFELNEHVPTGALYQTKTPIEVSVCREGRRAKCHILAFAEDNPQATKTHNLYNTGNNGALTSSNQFTQRNSALVKASNMSQQPVNPIGDAAMQIPSQTQLLEEVTALKMQAQQWQQEKARLESERQLAAQEAERVKVEQQKLVISELNSLIDTFLQTNGTQKTDAHAKALEPLMGCKDTAVLNTFKTVLADTVKANSHYAQKVQELQQQVEAAKKGQLAQQYWSLSAQQNKFADPTSRFTSPPEVNVTIAQPGLFFNPSTGGVTTPVQTTQQTVQQQTVVPQNNPGVPTVSNWSHPNQYTAWNPGMMAQPWMTRQAVDVKANSSNLAPGAVGMHFQNESFSLDKMAAFHHSTSSESPARQNIYGAYDNLNQGIREQSKNQQVARPF